MAGPLIPHHDFETAVANCLNCNVCDRPGTFAEARDVARIHSNVRRFVKDEFTVWRCTGCGSLHCKEDVDLAYYYGGYFYTDQQLDYFSRCAYAARIRQLRRWGWNTDRTLLDYGCGSGAFLRLLQERRRRRRRLRSVSRRLERPSRAGSDVRLRHGVRRHRARRRS